MHNSLHHLRTDERGISLVFTAISLLALLSATTLAIDVGMFMNTRSQAQNAADAGALAGATSLALNSYTDRSSTGPAVVGAINTALANSVGGGQVSVTPADVTFPVGPSGQSNRVQVQVFRTAARSNPVPTLMGTFFGVQTVDIGATATAEMSPANAEVCVLPFTIPDKWIEKSDGQGNIDGPWSPASAFDMYYTQGNKQNSGAALPTPDVYYPPGSANPSGYSLTTDVGLEIVLKNNNQSKIAPSFYNPWDLPGSVGGSDYRNNIGGCNTNMIKIGDFMTPETGNMVGPTKQGVDDLVAKDPDAVWDTSCNCVKGSAFSQSPRIGRVPLFDPVLYTVGQQTGKNSTLQVVNYLGFFIESANGSGDVTGRITPISGLVSGSGPAPAGAFPFAIRLVQ